MNDEVTGESAVFAERYRAGQDTKELAKGNSHLAAEDLDLALSSTYVFGMT